MAIDPGDVDSPYDNIYSIPGGNDAPKESDSVLGFAAGDRKTTTRFITTLRCSTSRGPCAMALRTRPMAAYRVGT